MMKGARASPHVRAMRSRDVDMLTLRKTLELEARRSGFTTKTQASRKKLSIRGFDKGWRLLHATLIRLCYFSMGKLARWAFSVALESEALFLVHLLG